MFCQRATTTYGCLPAEQSSQLPTSRLSLPGSDWTASFCNSSKIATFHESGLRQSWRIVLRRFRLRDSREAASQKRRHCCWCSATDPQRIQNNRRVAVESFVVQERNHQRTGTLSHRQQSPVMSVCVYSWKPQHAELAVWEALSQPSAVSFGLELC